MTARQQFAAVTVESSIVIMGGQSADGLKKVNDVYVSNDVGTTWILATDAALWSGKVD